MFSRSFLLCLCLTFVSSVFAWTVPSLAKASSAHLLHVTYKVVETPAKCPEGARPQGGCVWLNGKALESDASWPEMRRFAVVGAPAPTLPTGCDTASTSGVLISKHGRIHFKGKGYYCPRTDIAWYHYSFNAVQAKHYDLPVHGTIRYVGSSNTETFASSNH